MRNEEFRSALDQMATQVEKLLAQQGTWAGPMPLSPAAVDDVLWPAGPPSDVVRNSILSGAEHAQLMHVLLVADRPYPPTVIYSVLRGVLVGACQALWVVACRDDALRQARALAVTGEDYRLRRAHHAGQTLSHDSDRAAHAGGWVARWDERIAALKEVAAGLPRVDRVRLTDMIEWVATNVLEGSSDARATLLATWQVCSGYAHALPWGNFVLPGARPLDREAQGPTGFVVELDWPHAAGEALMCSQLLLLAHRDAWKWAGRTEPTPPPVVP